MSKRDQAKLRELTNRKITHRNTLDKELRTCSDPERCTLIRAAIREVSKPGLRKDWNKPR